MAASVTTSRCQPHILVSQQSVPSAAAVVVLAVLIFQEVDAVMLLARCTKSDDPLDLVCPAANTACGARHGFVNMFSTTLGICQLLSRRTCQLPSYTRHTLSSSITCRLVKGGHTLPRDKIGHQYLFSMHATPELQCSPFVAYGPHTVPRLEPCRPPSQKHPRCATANPALPTVAVTRTTSGFCAALHGRHRQQLLLQAVLQPLVAAAVDCAATINAAVAAAVRSSAQHSRTLAAA